MQRLLKIFGLMLSFFLYPFAAIGQDNDPKDVQQITQLIQRWAYARDQGQWDQLREAFHPEGTISISWMNGPYEKFVNASMSMSKAGTQTKHLIGIPVVRIHGNKALCEADAQILARVKIGVDEFDLISYARFYDRLEKRAGAWKIVERVGIYERDRLQPLGNSKELDAIAKSSSSYPAEYRYLAASLAVIKRSVVPSLVTSGSTEQARVYEEGSKWLAN